MGRGVSVPNPLGLTGARERLCFSSPSFGLQGLYECIDHVCAEPQGVAERGRGEGGCSLEPPSPVTGDGERPA